MAEAKRGARARAADAVLPTARNRNPAAAVYGTVIAGSLIAAETPDDIDLLRLSVVVVVTLVVYWAAHVYAELLASRVRYGRPTPRSEVTHLMRAEFPIVGASFAPLLVILLARTFGAGDQVAVQIALWSIAALLGGWALIAGRQSRLGGRELTLYVGLGTAFGCVIVLLKWALH